jgi:hypothetical protein
MTQQTLFDTRTIADGVTIYSPPAQRHSVTSKQAADSLEPQRLNDLQRQVMAFLRQRGDLGATDEEMQLGIPMAPSTQRPRRVELVGRGMVVEAGVRKTTSGRNACVWRCVSDWH